MGKLMTDQKQLNVGAAIRLDLLLAQEWRHLGRVEIQQMILHQQVYVNDLPARKVAQRLKPGDMVTVVLPVPEKHDNQTSPISVSVVFEEDQFLVVDKPAGLLIKTPIRKNQASLAAIISDLRPALTNVGGVGHAGIVTQMDEDASGLVLVAKSDLSYREFRKHLKRQRIHYTFTAMLDGSLRGEGTIEEPIGNARHQRERLQVSREGRPAVTHYRAQRHFKHEGQNYTLVVLEPETSRRHQMRVHMAWYGFPLVGDTLYGSRRQILLSDRIYLHLGILEFPHPVSSELVHVESQLPLELQSIITYFLRS
jgi:23S rRNA pseudouridine1911/1915/1917 synthase